MGSKHFKRVPLDFDWPMKQIWRGYVSPYSPVPCNVCDRRGYSKEYREMDASFRDFTIDELDIQALIEGRDLMDLTHVPLNDEQKKDAFPNGRLPYHNGYVPTLQEVMKQFRGYIGSQAKYHIINARLKLLGMPNECWFCKGQGSIWQNPEIEKAAEEWQDFDPPTGEGYQLWEDVSEGSPISPVFADLDALCEWASVNAYTFADDRASPEEWKRMLTDGFVYSQMGNCIFVG